MRGALERGSTCRRQHKARWRLPPARLQTPTSPISGIFCHATPIFLQWRSVRSTFARTMASSLSPWGVNRLVGTLFFVAARHTVRC